MEKADSRLRKRRRSRTGDPVDLGFAPRRVGLVLGGGAVRGAAHVGALQALREIGLVPGLVVGTSVGALVGAMYAAGVSPESLAEILRGMHWRDITRLSRPRRLGLLETSRLRALVEGLVGEVSFDELRIPFAAVACDITTGRRVVITSGSVLDAVMASSAIPGLFVPVQSGDAILVDGAVVDNLPVDVARSLGADYVVAVDVMPPTHGPRRPQDLRDMFLTSLEIMQRATEREGRFADCYIAPDIGGFAMADFSVVEELRCRGYDATAQVAPQLRHDLDLPETGDLPACEPGEPTAEPTSSEPASSEPASASGGPGV